MRYATIYERKGGDPYDFEDEPATVQVKARTMGCSCCSDTVTPTREDLEKELAATEAKATEIRRMLAEYF